VVQASAQTPDDAIAGSPAFPGAEGFGAFAHGGRRGRVIHVPVSGLRHRKTTVTKVIRPILPFFIAMIAVLLLCTFIPEISLWLPEKLGFLK